MTSLEKKAIDHCINNLKAVTTVEVWQYVSKALDANSVNTAEKKKILDDLSNAMQLYITNPAREAQAWLTEILKD